MCHSLANLKDHHFKLEGIASRVQGTSLFPRADLLPFGEGICLQEDDVTECALDERRATRCDKLQRLSSPSGWR